MNKILIVFAVFILSTSLAKAQYKYEKDWYRIDSMLEKEALPKTTLRYVNELYERARKDNSTDNVLRSIIYKINIQNTVLDDENIATRIKMADDELKIADNAVQTSLLHALKATILYTYLSQNYWRLNNITSTNTTVTQDMTAWNSTDFLREISVQFDSSLAYKNLLQAAPVNNYSQIIQKGNTRGLRLSLYDLVLQMKVDFYKDRERMDNMPNVEIFEVNKPAYFLPAREYVKLPLVSKDSLASNLITLQTFQELLQYYQDNNATNAHIQTDIERLKWVKNNIILPDKDTLYIVALQNVLQHNPNNDYARQAAVELAKYYISVAQTYQPYTDTANRYQYLTALNIIDTYASADTASIITRQLSELKDQILAKDFQVYIENVNTVNKPFRALVKYKNLSTIYTRIVRTNLQEAGFYNNKASWQKLLKTKVLRASSYQLPLSNDYQTHSTEIKIDALPPGNYILITSSSDNFDLQKGYLASQKFTVSDLAYLIMDKNVFIVDRESGLPVKQATVNLLHDNKIYKRLYSDSKGYVKIDEDDNVHQYKIYISHGIDSLNTEAYFYSTRYGEEEDTNVTEITYAEKNASTHFFTDRSIYRPGQTVYFKGIITTKDKNIGTPVLYKNIKEEKIILRNVNYTIIDSVTLTPNDYSAVNGSFKLPQNVLTGTFTIENVTHKGNINISVEEYKRPAYYITFDTIKTTYKLNDSISITGKAISYARSAVDNAIVKISILRKTVIPNPWLSGKSLPAESIQIIHAGATTTDAEGKFSFTFKAVPDEKINRQGNPYFNFITHAQITDNNGETHMAEMTLPVGYESTLLSIQAPEIIFADSLKNVKAVTTNLAGQAINAPVKISLYRLREPQRLIRERLWQRPDVFVMDKATYLYNFPHDEYDNEADKNTWEKDKAIYTKTINTSDDKLLNIAAKDLASGWYIIEADMLNMATEIRDKKYIFVLNPDQKKYTGSAYMLSAKMHRANYIGEKDIMAMGTAAQNVYVISASNTNDKNKKNQFSFDDFRLSDELILLAKNTNIHDITGFTKAYAFVKHNRFYTTNNYSVVSDSTKELNIQYTTFRDKTEPGSKEKWQLKITDKMGKPTAAELLSAMYDASLDALKPLQWNNPFTVNRLYSIIDFNAGYNQFNYNGSQLAGSLVTDNKYFIPTFDRLIFSELISKGTITVMLSGMHRYSKAEINEQVVAPAASAVMDTVTPQNAKRNIESILNYIPTRSNFNETAFFYPAIYADNDGNYTLNFTTPDALTKWRWMSFAYNQLSQHAYSEKNIFSHKMLMVQPNLPRFFRAGDEIEISAKISNLGEKDLDGAITLTLEDAITGETLQWQKLSNTNFSAKKGQSTTVKFPLQIPANATQPLLVRINGVSGKYADGEQHMIPVLTNKIFITETMPLYLPGDTTKHFVFEKLVNNNSNTLQTQALTIEFTPHPAWYAVQALPYLTESTYEASEQTFNRFYGNALAAHILQRFPVLKNALQEWQKDSTAVISPLEKNPELKQVILQETPWVLDAENETQQKKNIALLFEPTKMALRLQSTLTQLQQMQLSSGGFAWFKGGHEDRYITQYIVTGIGRLLKINAVNAQQKSILTEIAKKALVYLSSQLSNDYETLQRNIKSNELENNNINSLQIHYLFSKSYFNTTIITNAEKYFYIQAKTYWNQHSSYDKAMITAILYRNGDKKTAQNIILKSLLENAVEDPEKGTYWKDMRYGYYWYQAPVEQQALMIEITHEIAENEKEKNLFASINGMQNWLIRNKQTNNWKTTKATADACFALVSSNNLLDIQKSATIKLGDTTITSITQNNNVTGYTKTTIAGTQVKNEMGNVTVNVVSENKTPQEKSPAYGSLYWQYMEDIDKITNAATPISLTKQLFIENNAIQGKKLTPVANGSDVNVGDKLIVRIIIKADRDMQYIHLKDMRAAAMEPVNIISSYKWQNGLGYYEATKDAATNFFFDYLPQGTYVFDYPLYATHTGSYSLGIASVQCMYAPDFTSHSESLRIHIK